MGVIPGSRTCWATCAGGSPGAAPRVPNLRDRRAQRTRPRRLRGTSGRQRPASGHRMPADDTAAAAQHLARARRPGLASGDRTKHPHPRGVALPRSPQDHLTPIPRRIDSIKGRGHDLGHSWSVRGRWVSSSDGARLARYSPARQLAWRERISNPHGLTSRVPWLILNQ